MLERGIRLNPMPPAYYYWILGTSYRLTHQYDKAVVTHKKGLQVQPDHTFCLLGLTVAYNLDGLHEDARKTAAEYRRLNPKFSLKHFESALPYKDPTVTKRVIDALRKAGLK